MVRLKYLNSWGQAKLRRNITKCFCSLCNFTQFMNYPINCFTGIVHAKSTTTFRGIFRPNWLCNHFFNLTNFIPYTGSTNCRPVSHSQYYTLHNTKCTPQNSHFMVYKLNLPDKALLNISSKLKYIVQQLTLCKRFRMWKEFSVMKINMWNSVLIILWSIRTLHHILTFTWFPPFRTDKFPWPFSNIFSALI